METYRKTYEVLIASPNDLTEERSKIVRALCEWNFEHADESITFLPLLWEWNAVSNFEQGPQEAINEQLLKRADFMIAAFKGRIGSPTQDYPAGTIEELSKRNGRAAVFFPKKWPSPDANNPDYEEATEQLKQLRIFYKSVSNRFPLQYEGADDLLNKVKQTLTEWAKPDIEGCHQQLLTLCQGSYDPKKLLQVPFSSGEKASLLCYNTELGTLKNKNTFQEYWGFLKQAPWIEQIILLLPRFKIDRLKSYLSDSTGTADPELLKRFFVCPQRESSGASLNISSSLTFALLRHEASNMEANSASISYLTILAEPFASARSSAKGGPDLEWEYNYHFEVTTTCLQQKLQSLWDQSFQPTELQPIEKLAEQFIKDPNAAEVDAFLTQHTEYRNATAYDVAASLIDRLKTKLFDPNVPSYLLNERFDILDWNTAFELVFPTTHFYRHESVKEFVECLANKDEIKRRGAELIAGPPLFDMEQLGYRSARYGVMQFTKIASAVTDPDSATPKGWIVALNVNRVEKWDIYELDLRLANERQALVNEHIACFNRILGRFPAYTQLARLHVQTLVNADNVLDLGCGPGILALELLKAQKRVTAIDQTDGMLDSTRARCAGMRGLSVVKANIESLHRPNPQYSFSKVGIQKNYKGAAMMNVYHWLENPQLFLERLASEDLLAKNAVISISMLTNMRDINELLEAIQIFKQHQEEDGESSSDLWNEIDFNNFSSSLDKLADDANEMRIIGRYSEEQVLEHLQNAGYELIKHERPVLSVGDESFSPFAFFCAKRVR